MNHSIPSLDDTPVEIAHAQTASSVVRICEHAPPGGYLTVMQELRNDLIADALEQTRAAQALAKWLARALNAPEVSPCRT